MTSVDAISNSVFLGSGGKYSTCDSGFSRGGEDDMQAGAGRSKCRYTRPNGLRDSLGFEERMKTDVGRREVTKTWGYPMKGQS
jgi:hypothetical protein